MTAVDISTTRALAHGHLGACDGAEHTKACDMLTIEFAGLIGKQTPKVATPPAQGVRPGDWTTSEMLERAALIFDLQAQQAIGSSRSAHEECARALRDRSVLLKGAS